MSTQKYPTNETDLQKHDKVKNDEMVTESHVLCLHVTRYAGKIGALISIKRPFF